MSSIDMPLNYTVLELKKPEKHGYYKVRSNTGVEGIAYFGNSGFMGEHDSFFESDKFKASEINAWHELV